MNINEIATKADINKVIDTLEEIKESLKNAPKDKPVLRSVDVKKLLNISDSTLQRLRTSGNLPARKVNGIWFYSSKDVLSLLK
ncbi:MAG: DNA-binding protein [Pedobacter sp.]|nr:MAG: DNA-binding protein [Pedobacter sp.]